MPGALHAASCAVFAAQLCGYVALSTALQARYYHARAAQRAAWRSQPAAPPHLPDSLGARWQWALPLLDCARAAPAGDGTRQPRHPLHARYATFNLLASAAFAAATTEATLRGWSALTRQGGPAAVALGFLAAVALQSVLEYYWHALMHTGACYRRLHALHHYYKSPQPFDDLFIHPLEAVGYFCILFSPAFALPSLPLASFLAYMSLMGVCGVADHSGVRLRCRLPGGGVLYDSGEHDVHHSAGYGGGRYVNLAFPLTLLDKLHGTFVAPPRTQ